MMELEVILDFACCNCGCDTGVTLKCQGAGLATGPRGRAKVNVPCPTCGNINVVIFEPLTGYLHRVSPLWDTCPVPEPSLN